MTRFAIGATFSMIVLSLAATHGADDADGSKQREEARRDILELARLVEQGKDTAAKADAIRRKFDDLEPIARRVPVNRQGGIGFGKKGRNGGIELKIVQLVKRPLSPAALKGERDDLVKMGYVSVAMAEIITRYAPTDPRLAHKVKEWKEHSAAMKASSLELIRAAGRTTRRGYGPRRRNSRLLQRLPHGMHQG